MSADTHAPPTDPGLYWARKAGAWDVVKVHDPAGVAQQTGEFKGPGWMLVNSMDRGYLNCPVEHFEAEAWGPRLEPPS